MKSMAYNRHKFSGQLYKFVRETVGDTSSLKYYLTNSLAITAGLDIAGKMTIRSDEPIQIGWLIADIKDANGNPILDDTVWQVTNLEPVMSAFNTIDSYRVRAVKFQGTI
jgi:hypothetical protein